jgi:protein tyrosine/serine phosphatase
MSGFERQWTLNGVENFRDFGGYPAASGGVLRTGMLFRSAHHGGATDEDLARIDAIGLYAIVDLRRPTERERNPNRHGPGFTGQVIVNDDGDQPLDNFHQHMLTSDHSVESMRDFLRDYYQGAAFEPRHIDLYARYFRTLADASGPVLIHCAAGKDRTGLLAALTHHLLGVGADDMIADYLLTNDHARFERRAPLFASWVQDLTGRTPSREAIYAGMGVEAEYLHIAFNAIDGRCGSIDAYLERELGVDADVRRRIARRLIV